MSFFKKWFSKDNKPQNGKKLSQTSRSEQVTNVDALLQLKQTAQHAENPKLRCEALRKIADIDFLFNRYEQDNDDIVIDYADMLLRDKLASVGENDNIEQWLVHSFSFKTVKHLAANASNPTLRAAMLEKLDSNQAFSEVIAHTPHLQTKALAISQLTDIDSVRSLLNQFKGKQKVIYRAAKEQLKVLQNRQQQYDDYSTLLNEVVDGIKQQILTLNQLKKWQAQWQMIVNQSSPSEQVEYQQTLERAQAMLQKISDARELRQQLCQNVTNLGDTLLSTECSLNKAQFDKTLIDYQQQWVGLATWDGAEAKALAIRFEDQLGQTNKLANSYFQNQQAIQGQQKLLRQLNKQLKQKHIISDSELEKQQVRWLGLKKPQDVALQRELNSQFQEVLEKLKTHSVRLRGEQQANDKAIPEVIIQLSAAVKDGETKQAITLQSKARQIMRSEAGISKKVSDEVIADFKRSEARITELMQWQHFGTDQVREEIIDDMTQLAENKTLEIEAKAEAIKLLQSKWKSLDGNASKAVWQRFSDIANQAWAPCAEYFKAKRQSAKKDLTTRLVFLKESEKQLQQINWSQPDWHDIGEQFKLFEKKWSQLPSLAEQDKSRAFGAYRKVSAQWEKHLDPERKRELVRRENLIKKVEALHEISDVQQAVESVKQLQLQWKPTIVLKKRQEEQALWHRFSTASDTIFDKLGAQRSALKQAQNEQIASYQNILDEMEKLLETPNEHILSTQTQWQASLGVLAQFDDIERSARKPLQIQLETLSASYQALLDNAEQQSAVGYLAAMQRQDALCATLENKLLDEVDYAQITKDWGEVNLSKNNFQGDMSKRYEQAKKAQQDKKLPVVNETDLQTMRNICLIFETVANIDSPEPYQAERKAFQLKRLDDVMNGDKSFDNHHTSVGQFQLHYQWTSLSKAEYDESGVAIKEVPILIQRYQTATKGR